ncbi:DUF2726 domain-containing protein [Kushneria aurantia]|uniref:DUF2726 domain-containing protein n=1 Tax=Kushneria aurantia TaxID=504092 RepID=A0ABV6G3E9_9GAMM|nr:DUF2726 domain-containing protein [Kushneria aurantia]
MEIDFWQNILKPMLSVLWPLLIGALALKAIQVIWREKKIKNSKKDIHSEKKDKKNYSEKLMEKGGAYTARSHLMSPTEREVYNALERDYGQSFKIFCQVRVVDIIQPNTKKYHVKTREYQSLFRQLSQWHFDYVICDINNFEILYVLELDDASHEKEERQKRDRILNRACEVSGVKLRRFKLKKDKSVEVTYSSEMNKQKASRSFAEH